MCHNVGTRVPGSSITVARGECQSIIDDKACPMFIAMPIAKATLYMSIGHAIAESETVHGFALRVVMR